MSVPAQRRPVRRAGGAWDSGATLWTWSRTLAVLALAVGLGALSMIVYQAGHQQQRDLLADGVTVQAIVIASRSDRMDEWSEVAYLVGDVRHVVRIQQFWGGPLATGARISLQVDPVDPARVATADGYLNEGIVEWHGGAAAVGGCLAFVAVGGRVATVRRRAAAGSVEDVRPRAAPVRRDGVVRRVDVPAWTILALLLIGLVVFVADRWPPSLADTLRAAGFFGPPLVVMGIMALAGKVVVTADHLTVFGPFRIQRVCRHRILSVRSVQDGMIDLDVVGGRRVTIETASPMRTAQFADTRPAQLRTAARLRDLLADPAGTSAGHGGTADSTTGGLSTDDRHQGTGPAEQGPPVLTRSRPANIVLVTLAAGSFAALVVALGTGR
jgi:hypothetical protein